METAEVKAGEDLDVVKVEARAAAETEVDTAVATGPPLGLKHVLVFLRFER